MPGGSGRRLSVLEGEYAVCRLPAGAAVAPALLEAEARGGLIALARSGEELSVLCPARLAPEGAELSSGWRGLRVEGPLEHDQVGILAELTAPLARAEIPIFAASTFLTDYLLVPERELERARAALTAAGHAIDGG